MWGGIGLKSGDDANFPRAQPAGHEHIVDHGPVTRPAPTAGERVFNWPLASLRGGFPTAVPPPSEDGFRHWSVRESVR